MQRSITPQSFIKHCSALALFFVFAVGGGLAQQSQNGGLGLRVLVTDAQQRGVAGAVCSLSPANKSAKVATTASTDEQGVAKFSATLKPGNYTLLVESPGFEPERFGRQGWRDN